MEVDGLSDPVGLQFRAEDTGGDGERKADGLVGRLGKGAMELGAAPYHLGEQAAAAGILQAIERVLAEPKWRTRDLGGTADAGMLPCCRSSDQLNEAARKWGGRLKIR